MKLFTTSPMGLGVVAREDQRLLYHRRNGTGVIPILQYFFNPKELTASHMFFYKHGQQMMDAIFGKKHP
jgi:hypothetical protein